MLHHCYLGLILRIRSTSLNTFSPSLSFLLLSYSLSWRALNHPHRFLPNEAVHLQDVIVQNAADAVPAFAAGGIAGERKASLWFGA